jgi:hypothetical protein
MWSATVGSLAFKAGKGPRGAFRAGEVMAPGDRAPICTADRLRRTARADAAID